jgi:hypothetical protein
MVRNFIRLRDHKKAAEEEFKKSMERVNQGMAKLEALMLDHLSQSGANSINTDHGTVYILERTSATVKDRDAFIQYVVDNNAWDALDVKANKPFIKAQLDEGVVVPGVNFSSVNTVGVRRT